MMSVQYIYIILFHPVQVPEEVQDHLLHGCCGDGGSLLPPHPSPTYIHSASALLSALWLF